MKLFAVSQPGIEEITFKELKELGIDGKVVPGGIEFKGDLRELYKTNLWLRSASRVLVRLCTFKAKHFAELVRKAKKCNWEEFLTPEIPVKLRATSRRSKLYHTGAIKERVLRAIKEAGIEIKEAKYEDEGTSVIVRFENDLCTISVNSSGAHLHKRGYRVVETEAPLRENLAAAMILASGWKGEVPLIDPFCGSGTIPIEAALLATSTPPGKNRKFAFMKWPNFDGKLWEELLSEAEERRKEVKVSIFGFDIEEEAIRASVKNAEVAGVGEFTTFQNLSFPEVFFEEAVIVTNPPYGERLSIKNVREIYRRFGDWVRRHFKKYRVFFLSPDRTLAKVTGLNPEMVTYFSNGGITVGLYRAEKL
jgi:putative N6-adenine-specific DNA methylase